jgi:hypothetical protein
MGMQTSIIQADCSFAAEAKQARAKQRQPNLQRGGQHLAEHGTSAAQNHSSGPHGGGDLTLEGDNDTHVHGVGAAGEDAGVSAADAPDNDQDLGNDEMYLVEDYEEEDLNDVQRAPLEHGGVEHARCVLNGSESDVDDAAALDSGSDL